jgi:uncharacterized protein YtpQ (UPF0354 family)
MIWRALVGGILSALLAAGAGLSQIARPETVQDTLVLMQGSFAADPRILSAEIDRADAALKLTTPENQLLTAYPDNLHRNLQAAADDAVRQQVLDSFTATSLDAGLQAVQGADRIDLEKILPVLRVTEFARLEGNAPLSRSYVGDMSIFVVEDLPGGVSFLTDDALVELDLTETDLFRRALENMYEQNWQPRLEGGDGVFVMLLDGNYEATLLLIPEVWQQLDEIMEEVVVAVAARDLVMIADTGVPGAVDRLRGALPTPEENISYAISNRLLVWREARWQSFD